MASRAAEAREYFAKLFPIALREGPYHPATKAFLVAAFVGVAATARAAWASRVLGFVQPARGAQVAAQAAIGVWGLGVLALMRKQFGWWPLISFTMQSWTLLTVRSCLGAASAWSSKAGAVAEALRFPMLVQNSVTFLVWWTALVPIMVSRMETRKQRADFLAWNRSFFLLNVHVANLALAAASHLARPRLLAPFDLWAGIAGALSYLVFYLSALDRTGLHLYIILTPRARWSAAVYASLLGSYVLLWKGWNRLTVWCYPELAAKLAM
jgi:hypothetical protein